MVEIMCLKYVLRISVVITITLIFLVNSVNASYDHTQEFTSSGLFTVPSGVTTVYITAWGGGGGGGSDSIAAGGGGSGGVKVLNPVTVTPRSSITITIGNGGSGKSDNNDGGNGGTTSLGSFLSVLGGEGGKHTIDPGISTRGGNGGDTGGATGTTGAGTSGSTSGYTTGGSSGGGAYYTANGYSGGNMNGYSGGIGCSDTLVAGGGAAGYGGSGGNAGCSTTSVNNGGNAGPNTGAGGGAYSGPGGGPGNGAGSSGNGGSGKLIVYWNEPVESIEPTTTIELSGISGNNGYFISNVQVTLTATDNVGGSGIAKTEYSLDNGGNWIQYINPFTISIEGMTTISYRSIDNAGNIEPTKTQEITIDKGIPDITISSPQAKDYLQSESLTLNLDASDTISGIDSITSSLDSLTVINGQVIDLSTLTIGQHTLTVNAIDKAGNTATKSVTFNLKRIGIVPAIVDVQPDTLNKASQGDAVTAYIFIEIPGYDVNAIDVSTVRLSTNNGIVSALPSPTEVSDHNGNGIPDLMVKFDRQAVIGIVDIGDVMIKITGKISGQAVSNPT